MAAGSASSLSQYAATVACTNTGTTNVASLTSLPASFTAAYGDAISCVVKNTPKVTYWDNSTTANGVVNGGTGTWDATTANWTTQNGGTNGIWAGDTSVATFGGLVAGPFTVTVSGPQSMGGLTFSTTGYTLSGSTLTGAASTNVLTAASGVSATVSSVLAGTTAFEKQGPGTLTLSGTNTYSGGLAVKAGVLNSSAQLSALGGSVSVDNGASLNLSNPTAAQIVYTGPWNIAGTLSYAHAGTTPKSIYKPGPTTFTNATINVTGSSPLETLDGSNRRLVLTGSSTIGSGSLNVSNFGDVSLEGNVDTTLAVTVDSTSRLQIYNGTIKIGTLSGAGTVAAAITGTAPTLSVGNGNGSSTFSGKLSSAVALGTGTNNWGLIKEGTGTLTLSGASSYTGTTTVNAGTLVLANSTNCGLPNSCPLSGGGELIVAQNATVVAGVANSGNPNPIGVWYPVNAGPAKITLRGKLIGDSTLESNLPLLVLDGGELATSSPSLSSRALDYGTHVLGSNVQVLSNSTISAAGVNTYTPGGTGFDIAASATLSVTGYFYTGSGAADKGFSITGGGKMVFSGPDNTAQGAITVSNGTLQVGNGGTTGSIASHASVALSTTNGNLSFKRSNAYSFGKVISGAGNVSQDGSGTTTLSGASTYTGDTNINAGTLAVGVTNALPAASAIKVNAGTLSLGSFSQTLSNGLTVTGGTLDMGSGGALILSGGTSNVSAITGSGSITVNTGAVLNLTAGISASNVNIVMAGGSVNLGTFTHSFGTLTQTSSSTLTFGAGSSLTVASIGSLGTGQTLTASGWVAGSTHFYATAVNGTPARNTVGQTPLNQIKLGGNAVSATYWASGTPGELTAAGSYTFWDVVTGNSQIDGGSGTWDGSTLNWSDSAGAANGTWAGGTSVATFGGASGGTVTVSGTQSMGGLTF
ncbi:autotransporter-associated beta strand protein, partial [Pseudacidovorax intermedius]